MNKTKTTQQTQVNKNKLVAYTLLDFWLAGSSSVLVDLDHVWSYIFHEKPPINFTGWDGRPFHHPLIFLLYAVIFSCIALAFISRWNVSVPLRHKHLSSARNKMQSKKDSELLHPLESSKQQTNTPLKLKV